MTIIKLVINKLSIIMHSFKNLADIIENKIIRVVYQAWVPIINYGIYIWGGANIQL